MWIVFRKLHHLSRLQVYSFQNCSATRHVRVRRSLILFIIVFQNLVCLCYPRSLRINKERRLSLKIFRRNLVGLIRDNHNVKNHYCTKMFLILRSFSSEYDPIYSSFSGSLNKLLSPGRRPVNFNIMWTIRIPYCDNNLSKWKISARGCCFITHNNLPIEFQFCWPYFWNAKRDLSFINKNSFKQIRRVSERCWCCYWLSREL